MVKYTQNNSSYDLRSDRMEKCRLHSKKYGWRINVLSITNFSRSSCPAKGTWNTEKLSLNSQISSKYPKILLSLTQLKKPNTLTHLNMKELSKELSGVSLVWEEKSINRWVTFLGINRALLFTLSSKSKVGTEVKINIFPFFFFRSLPAHILIFLLLSSFSHVLTWWCGMMNTHHDTRKCQFKIWTLKSSSSLFR